MVKSQNVGRIDTTKEQRKSRWKNQDAGGIWPEMHIRREGVEKERNRKDQYPAEEGRLSIAIRYLDVDMGLDLITGHMTAPYLSQLLAPQGYLP
jgi:hypothetical protein